MCESVTARKKRAAMKPILCLPAALALGACVTTPGVEGELPPLPEQVVAVAAPWQNLATARLVPEDNCYWYEHDGQVERTLLPLRTPEGRPICAATDG